MRSSKNTVALASRCDSDDDDDDDGDDGDDDDDDDDDAVDDDNDDDDDDEDDDDAGAVFEFKSPSLASLEIAFSASSRKYSNSWRSMNLGRGTYPCLSPRKDIILMP